MNQQDFWNGKFKIDSMFYGKEPNQFIKIESKLLADKSEVLCLGEGEGRNAIFLAKKGHKVTAFDSSDIGLEKLKLNAKNENLDIQTRCFDLNNWNDNTKYQNIITSYLHLEEPLRTQVFQKAYNTLLPNGYFIAEFFSKEQMNYNSGGPKNLNLLYDKDSLKSIFTTEEIIYLEQEEILLSEGIGHNGLANVIRIILKKI